LFRNILDVVSKNGNMLISLGLKPNGAMQDCEVAFLKDLATWTRAVGEGIFATRPWLVYGGLEPGQESGEFELDKKGIVFEDPTTVRRGRLKMHEGDIRFTRNKDGKTNHAARLSWPEEPLTLASFSAKGVGKEANVPLGVCVGATRAAGSVGGHPHGRDVRRELSARKGKARFLSGLVGQMMGRMNMKRVVTSAALLCALAAPLPAEDAPKPSSHTVRDLEGWTVRVDDRLLAPPNDELGARALRFLEARLFDIKAVVAAEPLARLQAVPIVLDLTHGKLGAAQYHPSAGWLANNGYATNLEKCVHIPQAADLPTPRSINEQPWFVLHELAHAYHDQVLGFEEPRIRKAYDDFKQSGHGEQALLYDGRRVRHYGLTDAKEFFAEMTESYFGVNDFFPFNRAELMTAEPEIYELMRAIWGPVAGGRRTSATQRKTSPRSQRQRVCAGSVRSKNL
jgi:hypothetical protein